ncbi:hypothetical protein BDN72DRAFT_278450 [Pluteus cervinus]|uniref:Uncharacterized protein n=1 Tax=Pluteus cervinus TaxID=181527 RepID=A0ACD3AG59_9AGAR|nr:hypothetical protein BDN72DRAFT_278450 [Pluteus cervinus]
MEIAAKSQLEETFLPRLPVELERAIFEDAARLSRQSIPLFMRVAHRVKEWLEPLLYSVVIVHQAYQGVKGYTPPIERLESYAPHVRHFLIYSLIIDEFCVDDLVKYLTLCTNLINVGLWIVYRHSEIAAALSSLPLERFSGPLLRFLPDIQRQIGGTQIAFPGLTHLELLYPDVQNLSGTSLQTAIISVL